MGTPDDYLTYAPRHVLIQEFIKSLHRGDAQRLTRIVFIGARHTGLDDEKRIKWTVGSTASLTVHLDKKTEFVAEFEVDGLYARGMRVAVSHGGRSLEFRYDAVPLFNVALFLFDDMTMYSEYVSFLLSRRFEGGMGREVLGALCNGCRVYDLVSRVPGPFGDPVEVRAEVRGPFEDPLRAYTAVYVDIGELASVLPQLFFKMPLSFKPPYVWVTEQRLESVAQYDRVIRVLRIVKATADACDGRVLPGVVSSVGMLLDRLDRRFLAFGLYGAGYPYPLRRGAFPPGSVRMGPDGVRVDGVPVAPLLDFVAKEAASLASSRKVALEARDSVLKELEAVARLNEGLVAEVMSGGG